jgi:hypothetical protein
MIIIIIIIYWMVNVRCFGYCVVTVAIDYYWLLLVTAVATGYRIFTVVFYMITFNYFTIIVGYNGTSACEVTVYKVDLLLVLHVQVVEQELFIVGVIYVRCGKRTVYCWCYICRLW